MLIDNITPNIQYEKEPDTGGNRKNTIFLQ